MVRYTMSNPWVAAFVHMEKSLSKVHFSIERAVPSIFGIVHVAFRAFPAIAHTASANRAQAAGVDCPIPLVRMACVCKNADIPGPVRQFTGMESFCTRTISLRTLCTDYRDPTAWRRR